MKRETLLHLAAPLQLTPPVELLEVISERFCTTTDNKHPDLAPGSGCFRWQRQPLDYVFSLVLLRDVSLIICHCNCCFLCWIKRNLFTVVAVNNVAVLHNTPPLPSLVYFDRFFFCPLSSSFKLDSARKSSTTTCTSE